MGWLVAIFDRAAGRIAYHEAHPDEPSATARLRWLWSLSACPSGRFIGWAKQQGACGWALRLGFNENGEETIQCLR